MRTGLVALLFLFLHHSSHLLLQSVLDTRLALEASRQKLTLGTLDVDLCPDLSVLEPFAAHAAGSGSLSPVLGGSSTRISEVPGLQVGLICVSTREATGRVTLERALGIRLVLDVVVEWTLVSLLGQMFLQVTSQIAPHLEVGRTVRTLVVLVAILIVIVLVVFTGRGRWRVDLQNREITQFLAQKRVVVGGRGCDRRQANLGADGGGVVGGEVRGRLDVILDETVDGGHLESIQVVAGSKVVGEDPVDLTLIVLEWEQAGGQAGGARLRAVLITRRPVRGQFLDARVLGNQRKQQLGLFRWFGLHSVAQLGSDVSTVLERDGGNYAHKPHVVGERRHQGQRRERYLLGDQAGEVRYEIHGLITQTDGVGKEQRNASEKDGFKKRKTCSGRNGRAMFWLRLFFSLDSQV